MRNKNSKNEFKELEELETLDEELTEEHEAEELEELEDIEQGHKNNKQAKRKSDYVYRPFIGKKGYPSPKTREKTREKIEKVANKHLRKLPYSDFTPIDTYNKSIIPPKNKKMFSKLVNKEYSDRRVFPMPYKILIMLILIVLTVGTGLGYYYNSSNPLTRLVAAVKKDYSINIIDKNNIKVFGLISKSLVGYTSTKDGIVKEDVPNVLVDSVIALHGILDEKKAFKPAVVSQVGQEFLKNETFGFIKNATYSQDSKTVSIECVGGLSDEEKFFNPKCRFSTYNFLIEYLLPNYVSSDYSTFDLTINKLVHLSNKLTNRLLGEWVAKNLTFDDFLEIYFNRLYYGNSIINLQFASQVLFKKNNIQDLTLAESIVLIKQIYDNNKNIYSDVKITSKDILDRLLKSKTITQTTYDTELASLESIEVSSIMNAYIMNLDGLIELGYKESLNRQKSDVYTTYDGPLINATVKTIVNTLADNKIPNASLLITKNNQIVSGYTVSYAPIVDEKGNKDLLPLFYKEYPTIPLYQSLKPFVYSSIKNANIDVPTLLLDKKYQNLIFSYRLARKSYNRTDYKGTTTLSAETLQVLNSGNLDLIPNDLKALFSRQLADSEYDLISFVSKNIYTDTFNKFFPNSKTEIDANSIANGLFTLNLYDSHLGFEALFKNGEVVNPYYLVAVNDKRIESNTSVVSNVDNQLQETLKLVFFDKYTDRDNVVYFVADYNMIFAYIEPAGYAISIWLGDINDPAKRNNYVATLNKLVKEVVALVPVDK